MSVEAREPSDLARERAQAAIEEMRANVERMRAEREKWQRDGRYELWRLAVYTLIGGAALLAAGAAVGRWLVP